MSGPDITTGELLDAQGAAGEFQDYRPGYPCDAPPDPCVKFDINSTDDLSAVFTVTEPLELLAFDIEGLDCVELEQVWGPNDGTHFAPVIVDGCTFNLNACTNRLAIPFAGRFRLRYKGEVGSATVVCNPIDCCYLTVSPKGNTMSCLPPPPPPLTNVELAQLLAFRKCDGGVVTPGESLAVCADIRAVNARIDNLPGPGASVSFRNTAGDPLPNNSRVVTPTDLTASQTAQDTATTATVNAAVAASRATSVNDGDAAGGGLTGTYPNPGLTPSAVATAMGLVSCTGLPITAGTSIATCADIASIGVGPGPDGSETKLTAGPNTTVTGTGTAANPYVVTSTASGGTTDGNISNVALSGSNLVFTGTGGGFNGAVNLAGLSGGSGDITGVAVSTGLTVADSAGPQPTIGVDVPALVTALDPSFVTPAELNAAIASAITAALAGASRTRADYFFVSFPNSGFSTGFVTFNTPFPPGTSVVVTISDYSNRDDSDDGDEVLWITNSNENGFSWQTKGDGVQPGRFSYHAVAAF